MGWYAGDKDAMSRVPWAMSRKQEKIKAKTPPCAMRLEQKTRKDKTKKPCAASRRNKQKTAYTNKEKMKNKKDWIIKVKVLS